MCTHTSLCPSGDLLYFSIDFAIVSVVAIYFLQMFVLNYKVI